MVPFAISLGLSTLFVTFNKNSSHQTRNLQLETYRVLNIIVLELKAHKKKKKKKIVDTTQFTQ